MKLIEFDKEMYDFKYIEREIEYFEKQGCTILIDSEFCVYAIENEKAHWIGYANPNDRKWFDTQFNDVRRGLR